MKACFRYSIHHHDLPQVVEMSFILSIHQSSFYDCTNIWGSRNCALVDRNVPFTFCQLLLMYFLRKKVFRTLEVQKLNYQSRSWTPETELLVKVMDRVGQNMESFKLLPGNVCIYREKFLNLEGYAFFNLKKLKEIWLASQEIFF